MLSFMRFSSRSKQANNTKMIQCTVHTTDTKRHFAFGRTQALTNIIIINESVFPRIFSSSPFGYLFAE
jgi:hypothetical protein